MAKVLKVLILLFDASIHNPTPTLCETKVITASTTLQMICIPHLPSFAICCHLCFSLRSPVAVPQPTWHAAMEGFPCRLFHLIHSPPSKFCSLIIIPVEIFSYKSSYNSNCHTVNPFFLLQSTYNFKKFYAFFKLGAMKGNCKLGKQMGFCFLCFLFSSLSLGSRHFSHHPLVITYSFSFPPLSRYVGGSLLLLRDLS